jgi:hypothetical protein
LLSVYTGRKEETMRHAKKLQAKSRAHEVRWLNGNMYLVTSGVSDYVYKVTLRQRGATCSCRWGQYQAALDGRSGCSHVVAVMDYLARQGNRTISAWDNMDAAERQHRPTINIGNGIILTTRKVQS